MLSTRKHRVHLGIHEKNRGNTQAQEEGEDDEGGSDTMSRTERSHTGRSKE